jgi:hypothetical protein
MSEEPSKDQPIDPNAYRSEMHLQCIGSFNAYTQDEPDCETLPDTQVQRSTSASSTMRGRHFC